MIHGIAIEGINTLTHWGLALCADLKVSAAESKSTWIDVPAANGSLYFSNSVTGAVVYKMRSISLTLISTKSIITGDPGPVEDDVLGEICAELNTLFGSKEVQLVLPDDVDHYFRCVPEFSVMPGYHSGRIIMEAAAYPYKFKHHITEVSRTLLANSAIVIRLNNEQMPVVPEITLTGSGWSITGNGVTKTVDIAETYKFPEFALKPGLNLFTAVTTAGGTITFEYQEGRL